MTPNSHLSEHGCPECALTTTRLTTDEFVTRAKHIHGNRYNYDKTHYTNYKSDVKITCLIHGDFEQSPNSHLGGSGCSKCEKGRPRLTTEEFIIKAKAKHGDKYDYDKVIYVDTYAKVTITCRTHGDFKQIPNNHLSGNGCPACYKASL